MSLQYNLVLCLSATTRVSIRWLGPFGERIFVRNSNLMGTLLCSHHYSQQSDYYKISYIPRLLCCNCMCKTMLQSDGQWSNFNKASFQFNLNYEQWVVSEMHFQLCCLLLGDVAHSSFWFQFKKSLTRRQNAIYEREVFFYSLYQFHRIFDDL